MDHHDGTTITGPAGTGVEVIYTVTADDPPDWAATIGAWFLTCPWQSPAWEHYAMSMIHLRDIPGVPPAVIRVDGATHELLLFACEPAFDDRPAPTSDPHTWRRLTPINLMEQLVLPDDASAKWVLDIAAHAVVTGRLWAEPPLSGQVEPWRSTLADIAARERGEHARG